MILKRFLPTILVTCLPWIGLAADSIPLFDGKSLEGWKANEHASTFEVKNGTIVAHGERSHLFYVGKEGNADFKNFDFSAEVLSKPGANSGIFFHTAFQNDGWPEQGFEVQINNTQPAHNGYLEMKKTGSLYGVRNIYKSPVQDNEWYTIKISVHAKHIQIRVNDALMVDYVEPSDPAYDTSHPKRRLSHGTFALQGHDIDSEASFRNIQVTPLPDDLTDSTPASASDSLAQQVVTLGSDNFPIIDFHTHLKGGLTVEQVLEHMRATGINHGIAVNGGIGFPITNSAGIEAFRQSMKGLPCFIALQAEGREWPTLFTPDAIAKFDYVFTDAMTIFDHRGKRARLWMKEEVDIPDKQAFMELLVKTIENIMDHEPIDIYVNATFLPDVIASEYDTLWTPERMDRVIAAAARNGVAVEISSRYKIPSAEFIRKAKKAGLKFTFGTNNIDANMERLEYALEMVQTCGLTWQDMWMPKPDGKKPAQVKARR